MKKERNKRMAPQFMETNIFQSDLKILNLPNLLEMFMSFILNKPLERKILKQEKFNTFKSG